MTINEKILSLANKYATELHGKISSRVEEMKKDDRSHYLIYQVLGITDIEGELIDVYQNKGRFLYKYAGAFLEEVALLCFREVYPNAARAKIENTMGRRPRMFEIDCLIGTEAIEIKWRDATTDGDHITKEHTRIQSIRDHGFTPIRIMFYYPNREQAMRVQAAVKALYTSVNGEYYQGEEAWQYLLARTHVDLKGILLEIVNAREKG